MSSGTYSPRGRKSSVWRQDSSLPRDRYGTPWGSTSRSVTCPETCAGGGARDEAREARRPSNKCNGMTYDARLDLVVYEHATSRVDGDGRWTGPESLASHFDGKELNSPNDVVCAADGSIYFTDPVYRRMPGFGIERDQELVFQGVYRIDPAGDLHLESRTSRPRMACARRQTARSCTSTTPSARTSGSSTLGPTGP